MARTTQSTSKAQSPKTAPKSKQKTKAAATAKSAAVASKVAIKKTVKSKPAKAASVKAKAAATTPKTTKAKTVAKPRAVSAVPKGYHTVTPSLIVRGAASAIEFYQAAFGATELKRTYAADGVTIANAAIKIGNSVVQISDEMPALGILSPASIGVATSVLQLYLDDVDAVWGRATEAASMVLLPLEDAYWGERTGKLVDPYGQVWVLSKKVENLTEKEIQARYEALLAPLSGSEVLETPVGEAVEAVAEVQSEENVPLVDITDAIAREAAKAAEAAQTSH